ncbi:FAD-binding oxidoreductase [Nocardia otitidiscaviarum]|uniref:FAD-binding oxidoreductase n=1 Tax=Nocardia otitidiscaviarum TaxID=1823 RepID=UPI0006949428|nr:FAD-binding oxidoreductase [Nocardia otitidiscaviarum]MBF6485943.1 FAD-binding oxidoreductase [Nocardia otitidiscaviarum]
MTNTATTEPTTTGPVFRPGEPGFDAELAGFQTAYTHRPALIVGALHAEDVRAAVEYAARRELPIAVQATGHGLSVAADGGVLISTRRMIDIRIDPASRTARVAAGVRSGALVEAAAAHGLAPLNGSSPTVGVVGYTLGGGIGILAREFGYAADHVRAVELVTADGRLRRLTPGDELFGAVLGTGGNFGVVTALELELMPLTWVYGGQLTFDTRLVEPALEAWRLWTDDLPESMTSAITMLTIPNIAQVPEPLRGRYTATIALAYTGDAAEGERLVAPLRAVGARLADDLRTMPYAESHGIHRDPADPHAYTATNALLSALPTQAAATFLDRTGPDSGVPVVAGLRHLGGALRRRGPAGIAVDHREAEYVARVIAAPEPGVDERLADIRAGLAPWTIGHHPNFLYGGGARADEEQTRQGYAPDTYERLAALKATHDPRNLFRSNRNIRPAQPATVRKPEVDREVTGA